MQRATLLNFIWNIQYANHFKKKLYPKFWINFAHVSIWIMLFEFIIFIFLSIQISNEFVEANIGEQMNWLWCVSFLVLWFKWQTTDEKHFSHLLKCFTGRQCDTLTERIRRKSRLGEKIDTIGKSKKIYAGGIEKSQKKCEIKEERNQICRAYSCYYFFRSYPIVEKVTQTQTQSHDTHVGHAKKIDGLQLLRFSQFSYNLALWIWYQKREKYAPL